MITEAVTTCTLEDVQFNLNDSLALSLTLHASFLALPGTRTCHNVVGLLALARAEIQLDVT